MLYGASAAADSRSITTRATLGLNWPRRTPRTGFGSPGSPRRKVWRAAKRAPAKSSTNRCGSFKRCGWQVKRPLPSTRTIVWSPLRLRPISTCAMIVATLGSTAVPLSVIAYNLGNLWRRLALPRRIGNWSLTSLQQRVVKTGGRLVRHARYYWLLLAEGHLSRRLFGSMLRMIAALPLPDG